MFGYRKRKNPLTLEIGRANIGKKYIFSTVAVPFPFNAFHATGLFRYPLKISGFLIRLFLIPF